MRFMAKITLLCLGIFSLNLPLVNSSLTINHHGIQSIAYAKAPSISITATDYYLTPRKIVLNKGETVHIILYNMGKKTHQLYISGTSIRLTTLPGLNQSTHFTAEQSGTYNFYIETLGRRAMRMKGVIIVK